MNNGHENELEARMERAERIIAALAEIQDETQSELRTLAKSQVLLSDALQRHIEHSRQRDAETTDKLNALIDLMDRHLREHPESH